MNRTYRRVLLTLAVLLGLLVSSRSAVPCKAARPFELHLLDVGQGQGVLIEADGRYMLIDGGGRASSSYVVSYLKEQGVEELDCIVLSHYDEDHMSGLIGALSVFPCGTLLLPSCTSEGELYNSFTAAAVSNGCEILHPQQGESFALGDAEVSVVGPMGTSYQRDNDYSLALRITFGDTAFLICGDAEQQSEQEMAESGEELRSDVYVVNHHGSSTSSTDAFLDAVSPRYAMISCGLGNGYGHPSMEALQRLQNHGASLFRTDLQGTVAAYSDGASVWFSADPCNDWSPGSGGDGTRALPESSEDPEEAAPASDEDYRYVCNTNTLKFHYPDCRSVGQMKENNRLYTDKSREELIAEGYEPCGNCKP